MGCDLRCGYVGRGDGEVVWTGIGGIGGLAGLRAGCESVLSFAVRAGLEDGLFGRGRVGQTLGGVVLEGGMPQPTFCNQLFAFALTNTTTSCRASTG